MGLFDDLDRLEPRGRDTIYEPPFTYVGSKARIAHLILPHIPVTDRYCEPFGGSAVILLNRPKCHLEVYNDTHQGLTNFYRVLRSKKLYQDLVDWLDLTVHSRSDFLKFKDTWSNIEDPVEKAGRWYYVNIYSFAGLCRNFGRITGIRGSKAGAIARYLQNFEYAHRRFENVQIECMDYLQIFSDYDHEDMVWFIDPPYLDTDPTIYGKIDHVELLDRVFELKGKVVVCGRPHPIYDSRKWDQRHDFKIHGAIKPQAFQDTNNKFEERDSGRPALDEIIWLRNC